MNNKGAISIFLMIIISSILIIFIMFFDFLSLKSCNNDIKRSVKLTSRNMLADYDDYIYNNYGILSYKKYDENRIKEEIIDKFNNFKSPINSYKIEKIDIEYSVVNMRNQKLLMDQILIFAKNNIAIEFIEYIGNKNNIKNKYMDKMDEVKSKLSKSKYYKKVSKIHKEMEYQRLKVNEFYNVLNTYKSLMNEFDEKLDYLLEVENDKNLDDQISKGVIKIKENYLIEYEKVKDEQELIKEIESLTILIFNKKAEKNKLKSDESLLVEEREVLEELINKKIDTLNSKLDIKYNEYKKLVSKGTGSNSYLKIIQDVKDKVNTFKKDIGIGRVESELEGEDSDCVEIKDIDKLFLNEYILGTFLTVVKSDVRNFELYNKYNRKYVTNSEVEYIINGKKESITNNGIIIGEILLIREAMNLAHLFIDNEKRDFILTTAKTPTVGLFLAAGITGIWSTAESFIDMVKIYSGEGTPLLKISDDNFVIDLGVILENKKLNLTTKDNEMFFYYNDYLRMFLLKENTKDTIHRMIEIINCNYKLENVNNSVENLIIKHNIKVNLLLTNKFTGKTKTIIFNINEGYLNE